MSYFKPRDDDKIDPEWVSGAIMEIRFLAEEERQKATSELSSWVASSIFCGKAAEPTDCFKLISELMRENDGHA